MLAFTIVGFIEVLVTEEALQSLLGAESGWRGLAVGPLIGALVQGGPFAFLGYRFVILKYSIYILLPSLAGLIANLIFGS